MLNRKRKVRLSILFFGILLVLWACREEGDGKIVSEGGMIEKAYKIYYIHSSGTKLEAEPYASGTTDPEVLVTELLEQLEKTPDSLKLKKTIPDEITILSHRTEKNTVILDFGESYHELKGIPEILRRAAVVKTLCQIDGVEKVQYMVSGQPLMYEETNPVGKMRAEDFIDNTSGETTYYQTVQLTLYYTNKDGKNLHQARHNVEFDGTISLEKLVLMQLIAGPLEEENLMSAMPENTTVNKVSSKDGICYVDLSRDFLAGKEGVSNEVIIYSIVNSLSEIGGITKVQLTADGEPITLYRENIPLDVPLERKLGIIETE